MKSAVKILGTLFGAGVPGGPLSPALKDWATDVAQFSCYKSDPAKAKQMLEAGSDPVEAIANEVGYEDAGYFGRLFRRHVRLTPAQYRKRFGDLRRAIRQPPDGQA